jgi:hypothetical protein
MARRPCSCETSLGRSTRMRILPICCPSAASRQKRRGGSPWSACCSLPKGSGDRPAADAVRGRIDWKYALGLSLADAGLDATGWIRRVGCDGLDTTGWMRRVGCDGPERVSLAHRHGKRRTAPLGSHAGALCGARVAQGARPTAHRFDACAGQDSSAQSCALRRTNAGACSRCAGAVLAEVAPQWLRAVPAVVTLRRIWEQQYHPRAQGAPMALP